jgi:catechol 2,3-dioxygenase-like lactoylglutathione lyase family enzyme
MPAGSLKGVQGVHHIAVSVPDLAKARRFYIDLLGAVEEVAPLSWRDNPFIDSVIGLPGSIADQFICRLGNVQIEVFEYLAPRSDPQDPDRGVNNFGYTHFALQVEDIQACYERLSAEGIRFHAPPDLSTIAIDATGNKTGYSATYCRDWFGNVFELIEIYPNDGLKPI